MRRFYAFLIMVFSMLAVVLFNVQGQYYSFRSGLEFSYGTEVTYLITPDEEVRDNFSIQEAADLISTRLEASGAKDYYVNYEVDSEPDIGGDARYQITIRLAGVESTLSDVLRSVETHGSIWVTTQDNERTDEGEDLIRGTASVDYNGSNAYVTIETTDTFRNNIGNNLEASSSADDGETTSGDKLIIWTDYEDNVDSYEEACIGETLAQQRMQDKILAVLDSSAFSTGDENNAPTITISAIGFSGDTSTQTLNASSAHSVVRMLNSQDIDFSIDRLHTSTISAQYGSDALLKISIAAIIALLIVSIILIFAYGISGVVGSVTTLFSLFITVVLYNAFSLAITPANMLAFAVSAGICLTILTTYFERYKDELYKGRTPSKANKESYKRTLSTALDASIFSLIVSVIIALVSRNSIQNFSLFLIISSFANILICLFGTRMLLYWVSNSKIANNKKLFRVKVEDIPDVKKDQSQTFFGKHEKFDPTKHQKRSLIGMLSLILVSAAALLVFTFTATTFRYTSDFDSYTTVQIVDRNGQDHFATEEDVYDFYERFELTPSSVSISVVADPNDETGDQQLYYVSADFAYVIDEDDSVRTNIMNLLLSPEYELEFSAAASEDVTYDSLYFLLVVPQVLTTNFNNAMLLILITACCAVLYIIIRFRYTFTVPTLAIMISTVLISAGVISLTRIPVSGNMGIAFLAGVIITAILEMIILVRYGQFVKESKAKVSTLEERREIIIKAYRRSLSTVLITYSSVCLLSLALLLISPSEMFSLYLVTILCSTIGLALLLYVFVPLYIFSEKHLRLSFLRKFAPRRSAKSKKRQEIRNKRSSSEPEEIIIPGIND